MDLVLLVVIVACLGIVFYATREKPVQDKLKEHIKAAEVVIASEIKEDAAKLEVKAEEIKKDVQAVTEEAKAVAQDVQVTVEKASVVVAEVAAVVEEVKAKVTKPKKAPKSPAKAEVAEKRTRKSGKFVGDDKSTPDVNEAFKDGKTPAKKPKSTKKKTQ